MKNAFQMDLKTSILLAMMFGISASFIANPSNLFRQDFNITFSKDTKSLLQPIIIPNLTALSERLFPTTPKSNETEIFVAENNDPSDYFIKKVYYPNDKKETTSSQSKYKKTKADNESELKENTNRFSSRYSSAGDDNLKEENYTSEENEDVKDNTEISSEEKNTKIVSDDSGEEDLLEKNKIQSRSDIITDDEKLKPYPGNLDPYPTISYFNDNTEVKSESYEDSNANDSGEIEESEIVPSTNKPYSELRGPTSFRNSKYIDGIQENYETPSTIIEEKNSSEEEEEEEKEEKRSAADYRDSGSKNYHSVQTPLVDIKFKGPHALKDDFEKSRTRLIEPIRRRPVSHNWPYSKAHLKEVDKSNEILNSGEKKDSDEWNTQKLETNSDLNALTRATAKDEAEIAKILNKKYNYITGKSQEKELIKALEVEEAKDLESPLLQSFKQYKVQADEVEEPITQNKINYFKQKLPLIITEAVSPTIPSIKGKIQPTVHQKLFHQHPKTPKIIPTKFNLTKELGAFQEKLFLGPVVFKQNNEQQKAEPAEKTYAETLITQNQIGRDNFFTDLEKKETIDQQNLKNGKVHKSVLNPTTKDISSQSFNHEEESDEMYNQILANIQSVFGLRTQPLKSSGNRKEDQQELKFEENKALTWAMPLRKVRKTNHEQTTLK